jgi:hypothetical protein
MRRLDSAPTAVRTCQGASGPWDRRQLLRVSTRRGEASGGVRIWIQAFAGMTIISLVMRGLDPRICRWLCAITEAASVGQGHSPVLSVIRRKAHFLIKGQGSRAVERAGFDYHASRSP